MRFFERLPQGLFNILTSQNRGIYLESLYLIYDASLYYSNRIPADYLRKTLIEELSLKLQDYAPELDDDTTFESGDSDAQRKVYSIIRNHETHGWIREGFIEENSIRNGYLIEKHALILLRVLMSEEDETNISYKGFVYSTFSVLLAAEQRPDGEYKGLANPENRYDALMEALKHTNEFLRSLDVLWEGIAGYMSRIKSLGDDDLIEEHFNGYLKRISAGAISPMMTNDSVLRFGNAIRAIVGRWTTDEEILKELVKVHMERNPDISEREAELKINATLTMIDDTYRNVMPRIKEIFSLHVRYSNAVLERLKKMYVQGQSVQGAILRIFDSARKNKWVQDEMAENLNLTTVRCLWPSSLLIRKQPVRIDDSGIQPIQEDAISDEELDELTKEAKPKFPAARIDSFVLSSMKDRKTITTENLNIDSIEDVVCLIYALLVQEEDNRPFVCEWLDGHIHKNGWNLPNAVFRCREQKNPDERNEE